MSDHERRPIRPSTNPRPLAGLMAVAVLQAPFLAPSAVALEDIDGDGDRDAWIANGAQQDRLYVNDGTGHFSDVTATHLPMDDESTSSIVLADLDGDGDRDALIGTTGTIVCLPRVGCSFRREPNRLYLNDGAGHFVDVSATHMPWNLEITSGLALGDVDGDGDLDAFIGNYGQRNRLYLNDGAGQFTDVTQVRLPESPLGTGFFSLGRQYGPWDFRVGASTMAVALADVDGDGDCDAWMENRWERDRLFLGDGAGFFTVGMGRLPNHSDSTRALAVGDVDGDGDRDAWIGNSGQPRLFLNNGSGGFTDATITHLPTVAPDTYSLVLEDVDGDGDRDALLGNHGQNHLYLNDGAGHFTDATATHLPLLSDATRAVALEDVDGDGDRDALIGNFNEPNRLYLNDGAGTFTDVTATHLP